MVHSVEGLTSELSISVCYAVVLLHTMFITHRVGVPQGMISRLMTIAVFQMKSVLTEKFHQCRIKEFSFVKLKPTGSKLNQFVMNTPSVLSK